MQADENPERREVVESRQFDFTQTADAEEKKVMRNTASTLPFYGAASPKSAESVNDLASAGVFNMENFANRTQMN